MKEQGQDITRPFPIELKPQDRLFLEMAVVDGDREEASRLVEDYCMKTPDGFTPLGLCQDWLAGLKKAEKHHCQNVIDLNSQGKPIGGMQALATSIKKEV
jgi:hypothetical protein